MTGAGFRYPFERGGGRSALAVTTGTVLLVAVAGRVATTLYPLSLALVPAAGAALGVLVLAGVLATVTTDPADGVGDVGVLTVRGIRASLVAATVLAIPTALLLSSVTGISGVDADGDAGTSVFLLVGSTASLVAALAASYALPALVVATTRSGSLAGAVDDAELRPVLRDGRYLVAWTIGLPLFGFGWGLAGIAVGTGGPGGLLAAALSGYGLLAGAYVVGRGHRLATGRE